MTEHGMEPREERPIEEPKEDRPSLWVGPALLLLVVTVPVLILVFSNPDSQEVSWAGFSLDAPLWLILLITFIAGALVTRLFGWAWGAVMRRRKRIRNEYEARSGRG
jgi:uncharacterized integral membrane protein